MRRSIDIPLGVTVVKRKVGHPWQEYVWQAESVFLGADDTGTWRETRRGEAATHYYVGRHTLELHAMETTAYRVNLANGVPSVYIVMREAGSSAAGAPPVNIQLVTASPFDVQAYGQADGDVVGRVTMPEPLVALVQDFIATHHVEEPFIKRQRQKMDEAEHLFGQEPLVVLRERMRAATPPAAPGSKPPLPNP